MTQRHSPHQDSGQKQHQQQTDGTEHEPVTLEMLKAEEGLGPAATLSGGKFHASTEEFLESLKSR